MALSGGKWINILTRIEQDAATPQIVRRLTPSSSTLYFTHTTSPYAEKREEEKSPRYGKVPKLITRLKQGTPQTSSYTNRNAQTKQWAWGPILNI